jgi:GR25 family glycosyltransferase involved in LPS biosynthesis
LDRDIKIDKYFDKIYCINLDRRLDRREKFAKNYQNLGTNTITFYKATDGESVVDNEWQFSMGALGCRLSHLSIYKEALYNGYSKILVLEDDVIIKKSFQKSIKSIVSLTMDDWDMIYFGGRNFIEPETITNKIVKLKNTLTTHAIAINCRCLPKLILKIEQDKRAVDSVIADLHPELKVYGFKKAQAIQRRDYSDISNQYVDYNGSFLGRMYLKTTTLLNKIF